MTVMHLSRPFDAYMTDWLDLPPERRFEIVSEHPGQRMVASVEAAIGTAERLQCDVVFGVRGSSIRGAFEIFWSALAELFSSNLFPTQGLLECFSSSISVFEFPRIEIFTLRFFDHPTPLPSVGNSTRVALNVWNLC